MKNSTKRALRTFLQSFVVEEDIESEGEEE